ncbi:MAG: SDR family oxidoreductase, partial [Flavobacteriaceae bacterium]
DQARQKQTTVAEIRQAMEAQVPLQRLGKPEEYGALATFLASDQAAYITGTSIPIDGGLLRSL